jgi:PAS domain S-box-containing protein
MHALDDESAATRAAHLFGIAADYERALSVAAGAAVPDFADWCVIDYYVDGELRATHSAHADARHQALILEIRRRYRAERGENGDVLAAMATGQSLLYPDMSRIASVRLSADEETLLREIGLKSSIVVPMVERGEPLGVVSFVSTTRHYDEGDLATASRFAASCARLLAQTRAQEEVGRSLALLDSLYATAPVGLGFVDDELRFRRVNAQLAALSGIPAEAHLGRTGREVLGEMGEALMTHQSEVLASQRALVDHETTAATAARPDVQRVWLVSYAPVLRDGRGLGVSVVVQDITERRRAETRAAFLARAAQVLDSSLDYLETLRALARLAVPDIADWCSISTYDDRGRMHRLAVAHRDPACDALAQELIDRGALLANAPAGAAFATRTGRPTLVDDFTDAMLVASLPDVRSQEIVRALGTRSVISVPLAARGRTLGAISLIAGTPAHFSKEDLSVAEELARRAAVSIDNARLYTERSRIAHTLQASLLPTSLPEIPGLEMAARYRAAGELNEVGGDFYDAYLRSPGEWLIVLGDVAGKGADAAATMAMVRYTLRTAALRPGSPRDLLAELNDAIRAQEVSPCTVALVAVSERGVGPPALTLCLAGHPQPIGLRPDGATRVVGHPGTLLGRFPDPALRETPVTLEHGEILVLHTDGLTDAAPPRWSDEELHRQLREAPAGQLEGLLAYLEALAVDSAGGRPRDDIALLALRLRAAPPLARV